MDGLCAKILENYEIDIKAVKKTKGYYIINGGGMFYALRKTSDTPERIEFRYKFQQNLLQKRFKNIEKIYPTREGGLFAMHDDQRYVLSDHASGSEANFEDRGELSRVLYALADLHQKSREANAAREQFRAEDMGVRLAKIGTELSSLRKRISAAKSLSDFDLLFFRNYEYYENNIDVAISLLAAANYPEKIQEAFAQNSVCHNALKKETILLCGEQVFFAALGGISVDHFSSDIALIISKYMKYSEDRTISVMEIIDMYSNSGHNKLDENDCRLILARLLIPTVFMDATKQYYMKKRSWVPSAVTADLEHEINARDDFLRYIEPLAVYVGNEKL